MPNVDEVLSAFPGKRILITPRVATRLKPDARIAVETTRARRTGPCRNRTGCRRKAALPDMRFGSRAALRICLPGYIATAGSASYLPPPPDAGASQYRAPPVELAEQIHGQNHAGENM